MGMRSPHVKEGTIAAARLAGTEQRSRSAGQNEVAYGQPLARWTGPSRAEPRATIWAATFNLIGIAVLILDAAGYCIDANEAADRLLAATRLIRIRRGILVIHDKDTCRLVATAVQAAAPSSYALVVPATMVALTLEGNRHFAAQVISLSGSGPTGGIAALLLQEVGKLQPLPGEILVKLYGFTPTEARLVALLAQDFSLKDAATIMSIARTTAKTHLQRVFSKTGTNRQPQLVRLALSAFAAAPT
jgi:DNA-binding CsgD family transcriptional regulator